MNLFDVIEELVEDRGLDREVLSDIICEGMIAAYQRKYPELELQAKYDKKTGEITILVCKDVTASVGEIEDDLAQISLKKARFANKDIQVGEKLWLPFEGDIGRIEILRARQVIASSIRHVEAEAVYKQFKDREGQIVVGIIHKCERGGMAVKLDENLAFLPQSLTIPGDKCVVGFSIRALLKEVLPEPKNDNQLILDRASEGFLQQLFELEIPELFEKLIEIKKVVRIAGYKSKIVVFSNDLNIDPVGTCVGVGGSRIKPILKELGSEKIDIIAWSDTPEVLIKNSLKPAEVNRVELLGNGIARVWVDEDQRSLAIGKMGQNITLASRLTGVEIQLMQSSSIVSELIGAVDGEKE
ncbi:MAG: transcription termination factor NusA [Candidatus Dependentiae bacterium]|nr:transcription termination factor NusA [Candidatus Dependentiae bacterium]